MTNEYKKFKMRELSDTEKLVEWITKMYRKKQKCYRSPKRDFRMQAVLTYALNKARNELENKRLMKIIGWEGKKEACRSIENGNCTLHDVERREEPRAREADLRNCPELSSLDDFFQQLGLIKSPVIR